MTQKELNYIEDAYNHELLIINILSNYMNIIDEEDTLNIIDRHIKYHNNILKKLDEVMKG